jgi:hypothetical protein
MPITFINRNEVIFLLELDTQATIMPSFTGGTGRLTTNHNMTRARSQREEESEEH